MQFAIFCCYNNKTEKQKQSEINCRNVLGTPVKCHPRVKMKYMHCNYASRRYTYIHAYAHAYIYIQYICKYNINSTGH